MDTPSRERKEPVNLSSSADRARGRDQLARDRRWGIALAIILPIGLVVAVIVGTIRAGADTPIEAACYNAVASASDLSTDEISKSSDTNDAGATVRVTGELGAARWTCNADRGADDLISAFFEDGTGVIIPLSVR